MKIHCRVSLLLTCLLLYPACGLFNKGIRIGSKGSTEHQLVAEIAAQLLEKSNLRVDRRLGLGDSGILYAAISSGDLDLYPEDSLSAVTLTMKETPIMDASAAFERIRSEYARQYGLRVLPYLGASNQTVMVVLSSLAEKGGFSNLSGAAESKVQWQLGMTPDFASRGDSQGQLAVTYKMQQRYGAITLTGVELYKALKDGQVNIITGAKSDGMISDAEFQRLDDDKHIFPPSNFFVIARESLFTSNPGTEATLGRLTGKISTEELSRMVRDVEVAHRDLAAVAKDFLVRTGI